jgi:tRNA-dihydrouridine synthase
LPDAVLKLETAKQHALLLHKLLGDARASKEMRGHLVWYVKGIPGAPKLRARLMTTRSIEEIGVVLDEARSQCVSGLVETGQVVSG